MRVGSEFWIIEDGVLKHTLQRDTEEPCAFC